MSCTNSAKDTSPSSESTPTDPGEDPAPADTTVPTPAAGTVLLPEDGFTIEGLNLDIPLVEPPVTAATPESLGGPGTLAISVGLRGGFNLVDTVIDFDNDGTAAGQDCFRGGQYDNVCASFTPGSEGKIACQFAVDVKCRMFSQGPTYIKGMLEALDERTSEFVNRAEGKRVPCADSTDANYVSVPLDTNFTNLGTSRAGSPQSIDLGFSYSISCMDDLGVSPNGGNSFVGFGQKADADGNVTTFIREGNSRGGGSVAAVDQDGNVDFYKSLPEDKNATYASLQYSAGLIHIKVDASMGHLEMSFTGTGLGPGCGAVIKTDGSYLYAKANVNPDLKCSAAEQADAIGSAASGPSFDAANVDREFCLKVDQASSMTLTSLQTCKDRDLSAEDIGITYLKRASLESIYAAKLFSEKPTGVRDYSLEDIPVTQPAQNNTPDSPNPTTASAAQYTCSQSHEKPFSKNCSTLFFAASLEDATQKCRAAEAQDGHGCCTSSKVFTKAYGSVASFTVKPVGGTETVFQCE